jgi:hypothetical protein
VFLSFYRCAALLCRKVLWLKYVSSHANWLKCISVLPFDLSCLLYSLMKRREVCFCFFLCQYRLSTWVSLAGNRNVFDANAEIR